MCVRVRACVAMAIVLVIGCDMKVQRGCVVLLLLFFYVVVLQLSRVTSLLLFSLFCFFVFTFVLRSFVVIVS